MESSLSKDDIASNYNFEKRQADYYTNAGIYLGLVKREKSSKEIIYELTPLGIQIMGQKHREKVLNISQLILKHEVFHKTLREYFDTLSPATTENIVELMNLCYIHRVHKQSTFKRRSQTVIRWTEWILNLVE